MQPKHSAPMSSARNSTMLGRGSFCTDPSVQAPAASDNAERPVRRSVEVFMISLFVGLDLGEKRDCCQIKNSKAGMSFRSRDNASEIWNWTVWGLMPSRSAISL
mgnify:CR=1 FL=1